MACVADMGAHWLTLADMDAHAEGDGEAHRSLGPKKRLPVKVALRECKAQVIGLEGEELCGAPLAC